MSGVCQGRKQPLHYIIENKYLPPPLAWAERPFSASSLWSALCGSHTDFCPHCGAAPLPRGSDPPLRQRGDQTPHCLCRLPSGPADPNTTCDRFPCADNCCTSVWARGWGDGSVLWPHESCLGTSACVCSWA